MMMIWLLIILFFLRVLLYICVYIFTHIPYNYVIILFLITNEISKISMHSYKINHSGSK